jgi:hypothetical protein
LASYSKFCRLHARASSLRQARHLALPVGTKLIGGFSFVGGIVQLDIRTLWRIPAGLRDLATGHFGGNGLFQCPVVFSWRGAENCQSVRVSGLRGGVYARARFLETTRRYRYTYVLIYMNQVLYLPPATGHPDTLADSCGFAR